MYCSTFLEVEPESRAAKPAETGGNPRHALLGRPPPLALPFAGRHVPLAGLPRASRPPPRVPARAAPASRARLPAKWSGTLRARARLD